MKNIKSITKYMVAIVLGLGVVLGVSSLQAAWTTPPSSPPDGNVSAPLNVGLNTQSKLGQLFINTDAGNPYAVGLQVFGKSIFNGAVQIDHGTPADGKVLTATDADGNTEWREVAGGEGAPLVVTEYTMDHTVSTADMDIGIHDYCALSHIHTGNQNFRQRVYRNTTTNHWIMHNEFAGDMAAMCFDGNISGGGGTTQVLLDAPVVLFNPRNTANFPTSVGRAAVVAGSGTIQAGTTSGVPAGAKAVLLYGNIDDNSGVNMYIRYKHPSQTNWKRLTFSANAYYSTNNSVWVPLDSSGRLQWETKAGAATEEIKLEIQGYEI